MRSYAPYAETCSFPYQVRNLLLQVVSERNIEVCPATTPVRR